VKFGSLVAECEACGVKEIIQPSTSKRTFMLKLNRFVREHRMHEWKKGVGVGRTRKLSKGEQQKRALRRVPIPGKRSQIN
jgi:hypothetical protein